MHALEMCWNVKAGDGPLNTCIQADESDGPFMLKWMMPWEQCPYYSFKALFYISFLLIYKIKSMEVVDREEST